ncbi:MAG TPA: pyridoxamine 5'-phosphate oxidase family protein, partial [Candidatus Acidoferrum sp.]
MLEPRVSRPYWPDALKKPPEDASSLKPWSWAVERLEQSHNYWIATSRPDRRPHLMIVWGIWWRDAFWFSTGPRTRKAKNIAEVPQ